MDINKKLNELPVFMKEKSIDISAAIGSIGLMEAEAIVVLLKTILVSGPRYLMILTRLKKSGSLKNLNWKRCRRNNRFQG